MILISSSLTFTCTSSFGSFIRFKTVLFNLMFFLLFQLFGHFIGPLDSVYCTSSGINIFRFYAFLFEWLSPGHIYTLCCRPCQGLLFSHSTLFVNLTRSVYLCIIPLRAKRVGEFIETRHKKISPTRILSTLGCL